MSEAAPHLAHHFDDAEQQYAAAGLGMWLFLATEILFFGGLFLGYTAYRYGHPEAFATASGQLDIWLGTFNTGVLLASSLTMALAVRAAQTNQQKATAAFLGWTIVLGSIFLGIKAYEYYHKYEEHLIPGDAFQWPPAHDGGAAESTAAAEVSPGAVELFFSFYFAMTGLHALHMVIGVGALAVLLVMARRGAFSAEYYTPVEMTGLYWHFVDIVWVYLFPLLYLIH